MTIKNIVLLITVLLSACTKPPEGVTPIKNIDYQRYTGTWYEIMRLDNSFEKNLSNVTAKYILKNDSIEVKNRGFNQKKCLWKEITGIAKFNKNKTVGSLRISFFKPFYAGYHIIALDKKDYSYAMVTGSNKKYLWILSRTPEIKENVLKKLIKKAAYLGYETEKLITVKHKITNNCNIKF